MEPPASRCRSTRPDRSSARLRPALSTPARLLHTYAVLVSIEAGRAGVVTDEYLGAVRAETTWSVLELCAAGLWERGNDGYLVCEAETMRMVAEVHRQLTALADACRAAGGHVSAIASPHECRSCGVRLTV